MVGKEVRHPLTPALPDRRRRDPRRPEVRHRRRQGDPAHDFNDFETGKRHGLPMITVIGPDGRMTLEAGPVATLDRFEAASG